MPVIIDGHNLLHSIHKVGGGHEVLSELQLCLIIGRYLRRNGESGEIVFDGVGPADKSGFDNISNMEISFAGQDSADTVIEHKIKANTAPKRLSIISSDRRLRRAAQTRKATAVKSEDFWRDVQKRLRRKKTVKEPIEKHLGLTESETKQWLEYFGFEQ
jgi:predicted RNA-binding protein with PIN domain